MIRTLFLMFSTILLAGISGCAISHTPYDATYAAYGGRWQRTDRVHGRVGSIFTDVGSRVMAPGETEDSATINDIYPEMGIDAPPVPPNDTPAREK